MMSMRTLMGGSLLGLSLACVGLLGCGGESGSGGRTAEGAHDAREAEARHALVAAREANTLEAYESVMNKYEGTRGADEARMELARQVAELARAAMGRGDREEARAMAARAMQLGDPMIAQQATDTLQQVDQADAREAAERVEAVLAKDSSLAGCEKAIKVVANTLGPEPSKLLVRDVRKSSLQPLANCLRAAVDAAEADGSFAAPRKVIEASETEQALGPDMRFSVLSALNDKVVAALGTATQGDLEAGRWKEAFATIDQWGADGRAGKAQVEAAKQNARDVITEKLLGQGRAALGGKEADKVLADIDRALALFEGMNVAAELGTLRAHLATWTECKRLACTALAKPEVAYNFGATGLHPSTSAQGAETTRLANGTRVWVLARGRGFSLVSLTEPADVKDWHARAKAAGGWIAADTLKREETKTWLPVGQALVGERVWLPTGRDDGLYQLGVVQSVDGTKVAVKKEADDRTDTVSRNDLRSGVLTQGTRVLAFCRDTLNLTPARMEEVTHGSRSPRAKVTCLNDDGSDGNKHEELLGALRAKPEWLPARRP